MHQGRAIGSTSYCSGARRWQALSRAWVYHRCGDRIYQLLHCSRRRQAMSRAGVHQGGARVHQLLHCSRRWQALSRAGVHQVSDGINQLLQSPTAGGKRCREPGCTKSAQRIRPTTASPTAVAGAVKSWGAPSRREDPPTTASAHGGGKRCQEPGCTKSCARAPPATAWRTVVAGAVESLGVPQGAEGSTNYCKAHGGGMRCREPGCTMSARGSTNYCKAHGGGKRCQEPGCTKSARGIHQLLQGSRRWQALSRAGVHQVDA